MLTLSDEHIETIGATSSYHMMIPADTLAVSVDDHTILTDVFVSTSELPFQSALGTLRYLFLHVMTRSRGLTAILWSLWQSS